ncbi:MAG: UDP-N-acetylmuramate dehydrogenase, partial [Flavitalea sp.]
MQIQQHKSLKQYNTFGINVSAKEYAEFESIEDLQQIDLNRYHLVLGGGSNILFTQNINGLVLKNNIRGIDVIGETDDHVFIKAGAGENWHQLVLSTVNRGLGGMENLSLIPGNTGASPMQNIGAYGVEIKDIFHSLEAYNILDKTMVTFKNADCIFGYRESVFKNKYKGQFIISSVSFRLNKNPSINTSYGAIRQELEKMGVINPGVKDVSNAVINIRSSKLPDPKLIGNAGSFFKNPLVDTALADTIKSSFPSMPYFPTGNKVKLAAGWLIEQCGWKGYRKGDAGCYDKQALVLVNFGTANGSEI